MTKKRNPPAESAVDPRSPIPEKGIPFVSPDNCWNVHPTGDMNRDLKTGRAHADALLAWMKYSNKRHEVDAFMMLQIIVEAMLPKESRDWVKTGFFNRLAEHLLDVDPQEPRGANHLLVDGCVLSPASCPRTVDRIRARSVAVDIVDVSELEKAEAGVSCSSLIFDVP